VIKEKKIEHKEKRNAINDDHKEKDDDMATSNLSIIGNPKIVRIFTEFLRR